MPSFPLGTFLLTRKSASHHHILPFHHTLVHVLETVQMPDLLGQDQGA